jgi:hypothetical protein
VSVLTTMILGFDEGPFPAPTGSRRGFGWN